MKKLFSKFLISIFILISTSNVALAASNSLSSRYNIVINDLEINMVVNEDHSYNITTREKVTLNTYLHGIYRAIAQSGTYYRSVNGQAVATPYYAVIKNVRVESGQKFDTYTEGDAFVIQMGDPNRLVTGPQEYVYSYTYDPGDDGIIEYDDVYQNFVSNLNESPIEHMTIHIEMPKAFDSSDNNITFYNGQYGTTSAPDITYTVNGLNIDAETTNTIYPGDVVGMQITLPNNYFVGARTGAEYVNIFYIFVLILLIISVLVYFIYGKSKKPLEPISFYPPNDFDSAQVGYIVNNTATNEEIVSLIFYFADKGWLTIENISKNPKKPELILHKVEQIPVSRPIYERILFDAFFKKSDNPNLDSLTNTRRMGEAFLDAKQELRQWFSGENRILSGKAYLSKAVTVLCILAQSFFFGVLGSNLIIRSIDPAMLAIFSVASLLGPITMVFNHKKKLIASFFLVLIGFFLSWLFIGHIFVILVNFLSLICYGLLGSFSNRRDQKSNQWLGECLGFKHFIETAELNQLKLLVEENPEYYYDILPYAYALNLTDKWAKNFEGIALNPPTWYYDPYFSPFDMYLSMRLLNHTMVRQMNQLNTTSYRNMGSGGFGGGGFSGGGFGGGGFGGGGAGGFGGGGW